MENSAPQTQYLGHVFIDVIFRFSPCSLCVHAGPFPVMPHVAAPKLTPDSTEALFWLDSLQMQIPRRPTHSYMTSLTEPTWFPTGRLDIRVWTGEAVETPGTCQQYVGWGSTCLPQLSVTFLPHLTCPSPHCLPVWLLVSSLCCLFYPLSVIHFLTEDHVKA